MKPKLHLVLSLYLAIASLVLCGSSPYQPTYLFLREPVVGHSVMEAFNHALAVVETKYAMPGLTQLTWVESTDNHPDSFGATHHVFINKAETLSEIQAAYAINPAHAGFTTGQFTVYIHAPDDQQFSHKITIFDAENHTQWMGTVDVDGHCAEYMCFK